ncbi:DUF2651 family protein [Clostridium sp.]|uniref:DUF2651 family protein n=1 Tax=Clostridium sp. TaxID=1506 RepID=UPI0039C89082
MGLVLFTLPLLVFVVSFLMQLIFKKRLIILLINFSCWLIATFTIFNSSFIIYCFIYTFISFIGTLICDLIIYLRKNLLHKNSK